MGFQAFLNNPTYYLNHHRMLLNGQGANLVNAGAMNRVNHGANPVFGQTHEYVHNNNVSMIQQLAVGYNNFLAHGISRLGLINKRCVTYAPVPGGGHPQLRFLPWDQATVTFMQLDAGARFFLTGPLGGCTVAVTRHAGAVWVFHANVAGGGGVNAANLAVKRQMIQHAGNGAGIPGANVYHFCQYGPQHDYQGQGFVWGQFHAGAGAGAGAGVWRFYQHCVQPADGCFNIDTTNTGMWAVL